MFEEYQSDEFVPARVEVFRDNERRRVDEIVQDVLRLVS
jgi:hypothetical protein